jgi:hypothetical protein
MAKLAPYLKLRSLTITRFPSPAKAVERQLNLIQPAGGFELS